MSQVTKVVPKRDFQLEVELDTGVKLIVDVKPLLVKPIFAPLTDEALFRQVRVDDFGGLEWPNSRGHLCRLDSGPNDPSRIPCRRSLRKIGDPSIPAGWGDQ